VRLSSLEALPSFALLGPGFGGGRFLLLTELREADGDPDLVFTPFEADGRAPREMRGAVRPVDLEMDVAPRPVAVSLPAEGHREAVARIREAIEAGDVYQVCHCLLAPVGEASGAEVFALACRREVPRFACWVRAPWGEEFVSASPELFFEIDGGRIRSEPMKGTGRPGATALEASEKDRAELAMITDLVRNDLAQVCRPRSVRVARERRIVELAYALQAVSDVEGELAPGATPLAALAALHPGGSVTGAPKRAALSMIRELEPRPRGAYCGSLGLVSGERAVFALLIRTAMRSAGGWTYGVGSGIVHDSDAALELEELRTKLGALWSPTPSSR
jgi:para-aminobenzoate synthetase component 1